VADLISIQTTVSGAPSPAPSLPPRGRGEWGRLTGITHALGPTTIESVTYQYDTAGNRISLTRGNAPGTNLPAAVQAAYDLANEQVQFNNGTLTYDQNGNLTNDGTNTYQWDARNRLIGISGGVTASFAYDALGRRISKTVNGTTTGYLYDGSNPVQELTGGSPSANLLTGLGIDEYFTRADAGGTRTFLADGLGSTLALADDAGAAQTSYTYDPFGATSASGAASANSFQFTGRENDATGLYYLRARYYSPTLQRFISEDPLHLGSGQLVRQVAPGLRAVSAALIRRTELLNQYAYVINNPLKFIDPLGLVLTEEQHMAVSLASGVGSTIGFILLPEAPIFGSAVGSALFGAATAAVLGGTGEDVGNAFIGGYISGTVGGGAAKFFSYLAPNWLQAEIVTGIISTGFESLLWFTKPVLGAEPEDLGCRKC
jgi:RHS repeat-associated protein